jgi:hypothetical protein
MERFMTYMFTLIVIITGQALEYLFSISILHTTCIDFTNLSSPSVRCTTIHTAIISSIGVVNGRHSV